MAFHRPASLSLRLNNTRAGLFTRLFICLAGLIYLLFPCAAFSAETPAADFFSSDAPVELTADRLVFDKSSKTYSAEGSVVIAQKGTTIRADNATLNTGTNIAHAYGNIVMIDEGGNRVTAGSLTFNIKEKTAILKESTLFFQAEVNTYITGDLIKKVGPETYEADNLTYTTCDCDKGKAPDWSFSTTDAKVTIGQYLTGRHSFFRVRDVPIAYTPFLRVPIKRKRQTGFLKPEPGYSPLRGFIFDNSFFWARSINTDVTLYLDIQTARGIGEGAEYRYIRTTNSFGKIYLYHFTEKDMERVRTFRANNGNLNRPASAGENRWQFKLKHTEIFDNGFRLKANIHLVSDDEFLLDFGNDNKAKSLESLESNVSLSKSWSGYSLVVQLRLFDNLLLGDDSSTFKKLPEISLTSTGKRIWNSPFYISLSSSYIYFSRKKGFTGHRLDVTEKISLPLRPGNYFDFTPYISPRATLYVVNKFATGWYFDRFLFSTGFDATTTLSRVFRPGWKRVTALKHRLRPKLSYTYTPEVDQSDHPKFDAVDMVGKVNRITYSLNSNLTGKISEKESTRYHEYLYFDISQSFNIFEAKRKVTSATDKRKPLSDVTSELILRPTTWSTLTSRLVFDVYERWVENSDVSLLLKGTEKNFVHFTYRYVKDSARYLEANISTALNSRFSVTYDKRFSFAADKSLEAAYGITYKRQCWTAHLKYIRRLEEKAVFLNFDLLGIGKVAGLSGKIESQ